MKNFARNFLEITLITLLVTCKPATKQTESKENWSFVFMSDIHLRPEKNAVKGFLNALSLARDFQPDFILTGGDLVADALKQPYSKADMLYKLYDSVSSLSEVPVYNTMGNHEIYGWLKSSGASPKNEEYGKKMFQKRIGKTYYSFTHKGWVFLVLDSVEEQPGGNGYYGRISDEEIEWLKAELAKIDKKTPIVISTHIPFFTMYTQMGDSSTATNSPGLVIVNSKQVFDLFKGYNLKLILQGHLHIFEDDTIFNTRIITGGSICGAWWDGPNEGTEEGFVKIEIKNDSLVSAKYIDDGWEAAKRLN
jgi:Icc protein